MEIYKSHLIHQAKTLREALAQLNLVENAKELILFVVNDINQVLGTITDGDIRRAILNDVDLRSDVTQAMNKNFKSLTQGDFSIETIDEFKSRNISFIPILNQNKELLNLIDLKKKKTLLPVDAVLMAGGRGSRLAPFTDNTPKPLLKIGEKPVIEYNIDRLINFGVENIYISINYLGHQIKEYFGDGSSKGIKIHYIEEDKPLGTFGALTLVDEFVHKEIIVMNSDLLTTLDYEQFYRTYNSDNADMQIAAIPYEVKIPYAVLETENNIIHDFKEKPTKVFYSNAGIYILKKELLQKIPANEFYNATDFMKMIIGEKKKVTSYSVLDYWLDIGSPEDFERAQIDIKKLKL